MEVRKVFINCFQVGSQNLGLRFSRPVMGDLGEIKEKVDEEYKNERHSLINNF